ncbi:MAG: hypothetical protein JNK14_00870 [Chitinophagaceae bacterium]|nr:hypothetical protein [Chitinophagaceae bacterium]
MKRSFLLVIIFFTGFISVHAQPAQSIYFELGGPGLASVNFDSRFSNKEDGVGGRIGIGGFSIDGTSALFIPVGINFILGKDNRNYFEFGGGVTPVIISDDLIDGDSFTGTFGHLLFGYRMQPANGGFTFRAFISPVFGSGGFIPYYGGVSFGYKFGGKGK